MTLHPCRVSLPADWVMPGANARPIADAATGEVFAEAGHGGLDFARVRDYAMAGRPRAARHGVPRPRADAEGAGDLSERTAEPLYRLSHRTGATMADNRIDIDGGIGTMFVIASKGGARCPTGMSISTAGRRCCRGRAVSWGSTSARRCRGVAVHINAFNFPVWGMLEKLAPTLLAGMPAIVKPATASGYVAEAAVGSCWRAASCPKARCSWCRAIWAICSTGSTGRTWSASRAPPTRR
jgi:oxepin-CoA hydrolase/3-oxo-5,6-dehydrosuberyl-CoA semialdehyde dehydrogenase